MKVFTELFAAVIITTVLAVVGGCADGTLTPPHVLDAADAAHLESPEGAIRGALFTGRDSLVGFPFEATVSGDVATDTGGECSATTAVLAGTGVAKHMGRIDVEQHHCLEPGDPAAITDGAFTYRGANGDEIVGTYEGTLEPAGEEGGFHMTAEAEITGGTGRFAEAIGNGTLDGRIQPNGRFTYTLARWISYNASAGRDQ